jgi:hypothetical protein
MIRVSAEEIREYSLKSYHHRAENPIILACQEKYNAGFRVGKYVWSEKLQEVTVLMSKGELSNVSV